MNISSAARASGTRGRAGGEGGFGAATGRAPSLAAGFAVEVDAATAALTRAWAVERCGAASGEAQPNESASTSGSLTRFEASSCARD